MKKKRIVGWIGMLILTLCVFAACSDKDEPQPAPEPTPEIGGCPKPSVSNQEFQENVVGKFWHQTDFEWVSSDGETHDSHEIMFCGGFGVDSYDFLTNEKCDIYHNYYGTDLVPGKGWAYSTEDYIYDEKTGIIYLRRNTIPGGELKWDSGTMFVESVSETELVILTDFNWQYYYPDLEDPENSWESYSRLTLTPCTPEEIAKYKEDYVYMEF